MVRRVIGQGIVPLGPSTGPVIHGFTPLFLKGLAVIQLVASDCATVSSVDSCRRKSVNQGPKNGFPDTSMIASGSLRPPLQPFVPELLTVFFRDEKLPSSKLATPWHTLTCAFELPEFFITLPFSPSNATLDQFPTNTATCPIIQNSTLRLSVQFKSKSPHFRARC